MSTFLTPGDCADPEDCYPCEEEFPGVCEDCLTAGRNVQISGVTNPNCDVCALPNGTYAIVPASSGGQCDQTFGFAGGGLPPQPVFPPCDNSDVVLNVGACGQPNSQGGIVRVVLTVLPGPPKLIQLEVRVLFQYAKDVTFDRGNTAVSYFRKTATSCAGLAGNVPFSHTVIGEACDPPNGYGDYCNVAAATVTWN